MYIGLKKTMGNQSLFSYRNLKVGIRSIIIFKRMHFLHCTMVLLGLYCGHGAMLCEKCVKYNTQLQIKCNDCAASFLWSGLSFHF